MPAPAGAIVGLLPLYLRLSSVVTPGLRIPVAVEICYVVLVAALMASRIPHFSGKTLGTHPARVFHRRAVRGSRLGLLLLATFPMEVMIVLVALATSRHHSPGDSALPGVARACGCGEIGRWTGPFAVVLRLFSRPPSDYKGCALLRPTDARWFTLSLRYALGVRPKAPTRRLPFSAVRLAKRLEPARRHDRSWSCPALQGHRCRKKNCLNFLASSRNCFRTPRSASSSRNDHEIIAHYRRQDAQESHSCPHGRQGARRDDALRSHQGSHHLPLQVDR